MDGGRGTWLPKLRRLALRGFAALLGAVLLGAGWSFASSGRYLPAMDGNVYAMDPTDNSLFMVLSKEANNSLVHVDYHGNLLHYAITGPNQAFENLAVLRNTIYAILTTCRDGENRQELVALTMERPAMSLRTLLDLADLPGAREAGITWTGVYLPLEEEPSGLRLGGVGRDGQGFLLYWDLETGHAGLEQILEGETLYKLKYVDDGRYVWIDSRGRAGQYAGGVLQRDVLAGLAGTPFHISTYRDQVFIADSATGDVFALGEDGSARLRWSGADFIRDSGYRYRDLEIFTTSPDDQGEIQVVGLCASPGGGNAVTGPKGVLTELHMGRLRPAAILRRSWMAVLAAWLLLMPAAELLRGIFRSPRMAVRLALCELVMAGIMLGSVIGAQYRSYQDTLQSTAEQKLELLGGNLADRLTSDRVMTNEEVEEITRDVLARVSYRSQYAVNVIWDTDGGPVVGYDETVPTWYQVADVKSRDYCAAVSQGLTRPHGLRRIRNAANAEYLYFRRVTQGDWVGCVTVSQTEDNIAAGRASFWAATRLSLVVCPFLFAALILITRRLLRPLRVVREALEVFYETGGGNQMDLARMPRTELYDVGRVFNQLSHQTKVQFNTLARINGAYARLVPDCLCQMLQKPDVLSLSAGEYARVDGALLMLIPKAPARSAALLEELLSAAADRIAAHQGMIIDYDEGLGAVTAIFGRAEPARACADEYLSARDDADEQVMAAVFTESVEIGVFGSERLMYPLAVSGALHRRHAALSLLLEFGAVLVQSGGTEHSGLRLLGWDGGAAYYEDPAQRPAAWRAQWEPAAPLWAEAMAQFRNRQFAGAMRKFAKVLRLVPGDGAARWYLFRCESLRDMDPARPPDTGLLFDWRDRHG